MRKALGTIAAAAAIALTIGLGGAPAEAAKPKPQHWSLRIVDHNIAGGAIYGGRPEALAAVEQQIKAVNPHVVMMQEVCTTQVEEFKRLHPTWHVAVAEQRYSAPDCDGDPTTIDPEFGEHLPGDEQYDVLASPYPLNNVRAIDLGETSHSRVHHLLCADLPIERETVLACTTHIKVGWAEQQAVELGGMAPGMRARQIERVAAYVKPYEKRGPVVVAGDFNSAPFSPELSPMWRTAFYEAQQIVSRNGRIRFGGGPSTTNGISRLDYAWFGGTDRGPATTSGKFVCGVSDHCLYRAHAQIAR